MISRLRVAFTSLSLMTLPIAVSAQGFLDRVRQGTDGAASPSGLNQTGDLQAIIGNVIYVLLSLVGIILLLIMLYAGFLWMTAGGNTDQVKKARTMIINAIVGLIIVMASYAIVDFVLARIAESQGAGGGADTSPSI